MNTQINRVVHAQRSRRIMHQIQQHNERGVVEMRKYVAKKVSQEYADSLDRDGLLSAVRQLFRT